MEAAREIGLCDDGRAIIKEADMAPMLNEYRDHIGWHVERDNPSESILRKYFYGMQTEWLNVGREATIYNAEKFMFTCGASGKAIYEQNKRGRIYVRHGSYVEIEAASEAFVIVSLYDDCKASIKADAGARVYVYLHGDASVSEDTLKESKEIIIKKR